jgi:VWFA-related protein
MRTLLWAAISICWGQEAAFRSEKLLTRVAVRTADVAGRPIAGLGVEDFRAEEDGVAVSIEGVSQEELPLDLVLLLDVSHSMAASLRLLAQSGREALANLRKGDRIAVFTFAGDVRRELPLTEDFAAVNQCLDAVAAGKSRPSTALFKPIYEAAQYLQAASGKERRRAVLMVSDAKGYKAKSEKQTLEALWEADATMHLLHTPEPGAIRVARYASAAGFLMSANVPALVEKASGETLRMDDPDGGFGEILRRIRAHYTVYYSPNAQGKEERKVFVGLSETGKAKHPGGKATGRKEYRLAGH